MNRKKLISKVKQGKNSIMNKVREVTNRGGATGPRKSAEATQEEHFGPAEYFCPPDEEDILFIGNGYANVEVT